MSTTPRTTAALEWVRPAGNDSGPPNEQYVCADVASTLETKLAEAKAEAAHYMSVAQKATDDLTRLRADNVAAHQMACAAGLERDQLRAELKELSQAYELNRVSIDELDADRARAERAEAALAEWSVLNLWGGTPEIIHEFIKGQQNRIHHCQDLEAECLEQARLLGMSGEREADLLGKIERLAKDNARLDWLESPAGFDWQWNSPHSVIISRAAIDAAMKGTT